MTQFRLYGCPACGQLQFPPRRRCGRCSGTALGWMPASPRGVIEDATIVRRAAGLAPGEVRHLATVAHESGARLIVRTPEALPAGTAVRLEMHESDALWADATEG
ncbi:MAG: zinc ribbon domain-containing protein [Pigmentiphaga sp.]|nr:zinc ribbon domain-containing protein [Pigmentiphaga sp.]